MGGTNGPDAAGAAVLTGSTAPAVDISVSVSGFPDGVETSREGLPEIPETTGNPWAA